MMNERYDYREAVKNDALEAIRNQHKPETLADILDLFEKRLKSSGALATS